MISEEAVRKTIDDLGCRGLRNVLIVNAFEILLKHQEEIDEEHERRHHEIINEINPLGQD